MRNFRLVIVDLRTLKAVGSTSGLVFMGRNTSTSPTGSACESLSDDEIYFATVLTVPQAGLLPFLVEGEPSLLHRLSS